MPYPSHYSSSLSIPESYLHEIQSEQKELNKLKQQSNVINSLQHTFRSKDEQISKMMDQLDRCKGYQERYTQLKVYTNDLEAERDRRETELRILREQSDELIETNKTCMDKLNKNEKDRQEMLRERHQIENWNRQIEETFNEYRTECKSKENQLMAELEHTYAQIRQNNAKLENIDQCHLENQKLATETQKLKIQIEKLKDEAQTQRADGTLDHNEAIIKLIKQLEEKEEELNRSKMLNHELSIEFDKSVNKICEFEKELSQYRRQNHELKKTLTLFLQKEKTQQIFKKCFKKRKNHEENEDDKDEDSDYGYQDSIKQRYHNNSPNPSSEKY